MEELWPLGPLELSVSRAVEATACVLLTTGAMNPPHQGHAQLLRQAKLRLEAAGYQVWAAWISPSHDGYVGPKAVSKRTVRPGPRVQTCCRACETA